MSSQNLIFSNNLRRASIFKIFEDMHTRKEAIEQPNDGGHFKNLILSLLERAMELFLSKNPDRELRKGKRHLLGYVTSSKSTRPVQGKRAQGLILESSSDEDSDNEANHPSLVRPGEDLVADSSNSSSAEDDDEVED